MFGYLQPDKSELRIKEDELYKSVYCGLCRHLGRDYGFMAKMTLSYDCTVFAMLALSLENNNCKVNKASCTLNPAKKCLYCSSDSKAFELAGALSVIMAYYKMSDTISDSGLFKRIGAGTGRLLLSRSYRKASGAYPSIDAIASKMIDKQYEAEANCVGLDESSEATAKGVSQVCRMLSDDPSVQQILEVFGYYVGRWVYLMDAADDLEKDIKHHNFNPFIPKYNETGKNTEETMLYCNEVLNLTVSQIVLSYDLLPVDRFSPILDNVVYNGIPAQQKLRLFDKYKKGKEEKNRDYSDELF